MVCRRQRQMCIRDRISNIDMNIVINKNKIKSTNKGLILNRKKIVSEVIPSFTKKLFRVASSNV